MASAQQFDETVEEETTDVSSAESHTSGSGIIHSGGVDDNSDQGDLDTSLDADEIEEKNKTRQAYLPFVSFKRIEEFEKSMNFKICLTLYL